MKGRLLDVVSLFLVALAIRLLLVSSSPLPYNIDAYPLARLADDLVAGGAADYVGAPLLEYNAKLPAVPAMIAAASSLTGVPPLELTRWFFPLVASFAVVGVYALTLRVTQNRLASYVAGLFLAASGFFILVSASVMKETVALPLVPVILILFHGREDRRMRALLVPLLLLLPLLHHLTTLAVGSILVLWIVSDVARGVRFGGWSPRRGILDILTGPALMLPGLWYYVLSDLNHVDRVTNANDVALFLSVLLAAALFTIILTLPMATRSWLFASTQKRPWTRLVDEKLLIPVGAVLLLLLSTRMAIFSGTLKTNPSLPVIAAPYVVLVLLAFVGFNVVRTSRSAARPLVVAAVMGPFAIMSFGFLRGLDAFSLLLVYRTFTFVEFAIALCLGIGVAHLVARARGPSRKVLIGGAVAVALALSIVPAYDSLGLLGVQNETYPSELAALEHAASLPDGTVGTDQRLFDVGNPYFGLEGNGFLPRILARGEDPTAYDYLLIQSQWKTIGAQVYPSGRTVLTDEEYESLLSSSDLLYVTGPPGRQTLLLRPRG